jgi:hypothetical protein
VPHSAQQNMQRKPILMPPAMIARVEKIAKARKVSFAKVVRDAVEAFDDELAPEDEAILEALADNLITSTRKTIQRIDALMTRLDETHAILEAAHGDW